MKYISAKQAGEKWGIGERRVQYYCVNNRISGAKRVGKQWIIPEDAARPADGRTKQAKAAGINRPYRFPVFIFTGAFCADDLDEEERKLLRAQVLYLEGENAEGVRLCRELLDGGCDDVVRFGAYLTMGYLSMVLGLQSEHQNAVANAEDLLKKEKDHREDLKLALAALKYHTTWDFTPLQMLDISKLSPAVYPYYQSLLMLHSSMLAEKETADALQVYELTSHWAASGGILPLNAVLHFHIAALYSNRGDTVRRDEHIEQGCAVALKQGYYGLMAKHFFVMAEPFERVLGARSEKSLQHVREISLQNIENWKVFAGSARGRNPPSDAELADNEMIHLLISDFSVREISEIMGIPLNEANRRIRLLCDAANVSGKKELTAYSKLRLAGK